MARFYFSRRGIYDVAAWRRKLMWRAESAVVRTLVVVFRMLPLKASFAFGAWIGECMRPFTPRAEKVRSNLRMVFPDAREKRIERVTRASFANMGIAMAELANLERLWRARDERIEFCLLAGARQPDPAGRTIFVTAHLGPWQLTPLIGRYYGIKLPVIYAPERNPYVDRQLNQMRSVFDNRLVSRNGGIRMLVRSLDRGECIGMTVDTRMDGGEPIPFFGHPAPTNTTPARLALRYDCDLVPVIAERLPGACFRVNIHPPIQPRAGAQSRNEKARDMSEQINQLFETLIERQPDQWLCLRRRWSKQVQAQHASN